MANDDETRKNLRTSKRGIGKRNLTSDLSDQFESGNPAMPRIFGPTRHCCGMHQWGVGYRYEIGYLAKSCHYGLMSSYEI